MSESFHLRFVKGRVVAVGTAGGVLVAAKQEVLRGGYHSN